MALEPRRGRPVRRCLCARRTLRIATLTVLIFPLTSHLLSAETGAGILTHSISFQQLRQHLLSPSQWHPFPRVTERTTWESLPPATKASYLEAAKAHLHSDWPVLKATAFLEYVRSGDRQGYQTLSFERRDQLASLVLAECIEGRGQYRDDIINGIWAICEETYWGVPAHVGAQRRGSGLPDVTEPTVDLFAAETASLLAWTYYLLKDSLDAVSPLVSERIKYEVDRRINTPNLQRDDFWWMGLSRSVNNWTPWICSNWLASVLVIEQDPDRRARSVYKVMECLDRFLAGYTDDGGCDEGPGYWARAGASLFDCLELLQASTQGYVDFFDNSRIQEIGRFIMRAHISGSWYVNFADAAARLRPDAPTVYRYGKAISDSTMMGFAANLAQSQQLANNVLPAQFGVLGRALPGLFILQDLLKTKPVEPMLRDSWFPGIQVMTARSHTGSAEGIFLAAQGGNNNENHNHNDVGNFVVYVDGEPAIIDVGVETYTARTFSKDRYSIWTMQSVFHNVPRINGVAQNDGLEFAARNVRHEADGTKALLSMDIAKAYPPGANVRSWQRTIALDRKKKEVQIRDLFELNTLHDTTSFTLMTSRRPEIAAPGVVVLDRHPGGETATKVEIIYDATMLSALTEQIDIHDRQLQSSWGNKIWRIVLAMKKPAMKNECVVRIRKRQ
jgi:hypothetical protein